MSIFSTLNWNNHCFTSRKYKKLTKWKIMKKRKTKILSFSFLLFPLPSQRKKLYWSLKFFSQEMFEMTVSLRALVLIYCLIKSHISILYLLSPTVLLVAKGSGYYNSSRHRNIIKKKRTMTFFKKSQQNKSPNSWLQRKHTDKIGVEISASSKSST